jgi:hypothetical protein
MCSSQFQFFIIKVKLKSDANIASPYMRHSDQKTPEKSSYVDFMEVLFKGILIRLK